MSRTTPTGTHAAREKAADRAAAQVTARPGPVLAARRAERLSDPQASFEAVREPMEGALGHDFSSVHIHAGGAPSENAQRLGARALSYGNQVAFAPGEWAPGTRRGMNLLAHELAHVATQAREGTRRLDAKTLDEEVDEELAKHAAADPKSLDPKNKEYARALQGYGHDLTHKNMTDLLEEPTISAKDAKDPKKKAQHEKEKAEWKRRFQKAEILAGRILDKSGPDVEQKESRAQMLTSDLATAGFVTEAMTLARKFTDPDSRKFVYQEVLKRTDKVTSAQLVEITKFFLAKHKLADHPVVNKFDASGAYTKELGADAVNAVLAELLTAYGSEKDFPETMARIIFFDDRLQAGFTTMMISRKQGPLLRKISEQAYFVAGAKIQSGSSTINPSDAQVGWAIGNKQKVTVGEVIDLVKAAGDKMDPPTKYDAATLRAWLEKNTEKIGAALKKQHPGDPAVAEAMLRNITAAFMWHVDPDKEDIKPDKSGSVKSLTSASGGQKEQLKVDCDVLATYNVRLLVSAGFTPVGYMAVIPTDTSRAAHAMALVQHGQTYRALSNVETKSFAVPKDKDDALKTLRDFGIDEAYDKSKPLQGYKIYYKDSDAKGTLPDEVLNNDASALKAGLGK
ncbi:MAG: DUF4157 domain-containing protein [Actinomycetota bacterium]